MVACTHAPIPQEAEANNHLSSLDNIMRPCLNKAILNPCFDNPFDGLLPIFQ